MRSGRPSAWRHGYDLARETGLKSGTLYPILVRLADRESVQACWVAKNTKADDSRADGRSALH